MTRADKPRPAPIIIQDSDAADPRRISLPRDLEASILTGDQYFCCNCKCRAQSSDGGESCLCGHSCCSACETERCKIMADLESHEKEQAQRTINYEALLAMHEIYSIPLIPDLIVEGRANTDPEFLKIVDEVLDDATNAITPDERQFLSCAKSRSSFPQAVDPKWKLHEFMYGSKDLLEQEEIVAEYAKMTGQTLTISDLDQIKDNVEKKIVSFASKRGLSLRVFRSYTCLVAQPPPSEARKSYVSMRVANFWWACTCDLVGFDRPITRIVFEQGGFTDVEWSSTTLMDLMDKNLINTPNDVSYAVRLGINVMAGIRVVDSYNIVPFRYRLRTHPSIEKWRRVLTRWIRYKAFQYEGLVLQMQRELQAYATTSGIDKTA